MGFYNWFNIGVLLHIKDVVNYNEDFVIAGNLDKGIESIQDKNVDELISGDYPIKLAFTVVLICKEGEMNFKMNLNDYVLRKGQVLVANENSIIQNVNLNDDLRLEMLCLKSNEAYYDSLDSSVLNNYFKYIWRQPIFSISDEDMDDILSIIYHLKRKLMDETFAPKEKLIRQSLALMSVYIDQWFRDYDVQASNLNSRQEQMFNDFMNYVQLNFRKERAIGFYAEKLCVTPKYLSQVIHQVSGRFAGEWINDYLVLESKSLLKSGDCTAQQVSDILNFPSASYFGRFFKKENGFTPHEYMLL